MLPGSRSGPQVDRYRSSSVGSFPRASTFQWKTASGFIQGLIGGGGGGGGGGSDGSRTTLDVVVVAVVVVVVAVVGSIGSCSGRSWPCFDLAE